MADRTKYQRAAQGDIAYNMMRMWQGAVGVVPTDGLVSPAYVVARPYPEVDAAYFAYLFRTAGYMREVEICSRGIVPDRNRLYWDSFKQISSPVPPIDAQRLLVRFLDTHGVLTARLIRSKQRVIKLFEEQKQAIIRRAVTRGLDPNARLKPSGIPSFGDIPEHWALLKLRNCGRIFGGMTPSMAEPAYWNGTIPWVTPKDMKRAAIRSSQLNVTERALRDTSLRILPVDAVLLVVRGMILARFVPVAETTAPVTINQDIKAIIPNEIVHPSYFVRLLSSSQSAFAPLIDESGHGTRRFPTERWRDLLFAFPPHQEQAQILAYLTEVTTELV